jgi:uncharacterized membrane protein YphA (DoxX/SURF4 family)
MRQTKKEITIVALRVVLGLVVLVQSFIFLYSSESSRFLASHGLPDVIRVILGWGEVAAAILFLLPPTVVAGAWFLLLVFCAAIALHIAHRQFEVGSLLVYGVAVLVVLAHRAPRDVKAG